MTRHHPPSAPPVDLPTRGASTTSIASHVDLVAVSGALRRAAATGDVHGTHLELVRLRTALVEHLQAELGAVSRLSGAAAAVARDGQRRLLALLDDLLADTCDTCDTLGTCNCLVRAAEVGAALRRQARLEALVFAGHLGTEAE